MATPKEIVKFVKTRPETQKGLVLKMKEVSALTTGEKAKLT
jgi:hypothetical protein